MKPKAARFTRLIKLLTASVVRHWTHQADIDDGMEDGLTTAEQSEMVRLRRANWRLEMENEILRPAAAHFAKDALPK